MSVIIFDKFQINPEEILNFTIKEGDTLVGDLDKEKGKLVFTLQKKEKEKAPKLPKEPKEE